MYLRHFNFRGPTGPSRIPPAERDLILSNTLAQVFGDREMVGTLADYDNLAQAVAEYDASPCVTTLTAIRPLAMRCGMPESGRTLSWSRGRLAAYRRMTEAA